jgi:beta-phosphoglucomutase-like phosphatase (HAD superfamily)
VPGLLAFLDLLDRRGVRRVAVTNAPRENVEVMLRGLDLAHRFEAVVLGEECVRAKPYPDPYLEGLKILGMTADEAMAVEDSPSGLRAAVRAGLPCVGMLSGHNGDLLQREGACVTVGDYHQLMAALGVSAETAGAAAATCKD